MISVDHVLVEIRRCVSHIIRFLSVLVIATQLVRVDHRKHFAKTLSNARDSFRRISEGQLAPRHKVNLLAVQVY